MMNIMGKTQEIEDKEHWETWVSYRLLREYEKMAFQ